MLLLDQSKYTRQRQSLLNAVPKGTSNPVVVVVVARATVKFPLFCFVPLQRSHFRYRLPSSRLPPAFVFWRLKRPSPSITSCNHGIASRVPYHHLRIEGAVHAQTRRSATRGRSCRRSSHNNGLDFSPPPVLTPMRRLEPCHTEQLGCFDGPGFVGRSLELWSRGQNRSRQTATSALKAQCQPNCSGSLHHHKPLAPPRSSVSEPELLGAPFDPSIFEVSTAQVS
ncbi:uncharacterized protein CCOS01_05072 [Colletotrichum costaricense]|uniref:Uncharacterized protein n=1 Tax=Colletotrichum costaricense TaxID=1209916 RepID=A0AAJ0E399_9PEZI|nr:uncharacterized protein CCOS01_05072 [Colletotrichum costaricense]KAK1533089.1 hypothetical protein CCOS01_05072 [Colletotrichum costaricense]